MDYNFPSSRKRPLWVPMERKDGAMYLDLSEYDLSHEMYLRHQKKEPVVLKFLTFLAFCAVLTVIACII